MVTRVDFQIKKQIDPTSLETPSEEQQSKSRIGKIAEAVLKNPGKALLIGGLAALGIGVCYLYGPGIFSSVPSSGTPTPNPSPAGSPGGSVIPDPCLKRSFNINKCSFAEAYYKNKDQDPQFAGVMGRECFDHPDDKSCDPVIDDYLLALLGEKQDFIATDPVWEAVKKVTKHRRETACQNAIPKIFAACVAKADEEDAIRIVFDLGEPCFNPYGGEQPYCSELLKHPLMQRVAALTSPNHRIDEVQKVYSEWKANGFV